MLNVLKKIIRNVFMYLKQNILLFYYTYFNIITKNQNQNFKQIPIIILSFNQYFYLKQLVEFLLKNKYSNIIILDNNSTYVPLLAYLEEIKTHVTLHKLKTNEGHMVFWKNKEIFDMYSKGYYVVTDSDIVPVENCPSDFLLHFKKILDSNYQISKVGFSLKIDDIPNANSNKQKIVDWESKFWQTLDKQGNYIAPIDTTFALYKPNSYHIANDFFYKAIRVKKPYLAVHGGWYIDTAHLNEEQSYYYKTANSSSSWKTNESGIVEKSLYNKK